MGSSTVRWYQRIENGFMVAVFSATIALPLINAIGRPFNFALEGHSDYMRHLVLWLSFLGGLLATRSKKHLCFSTAEFLKNHPAGAPLNVLAMGIAAAISLIMAQSSWLVVKANRQMAESRAAVDVLPFGIPDWLSESIMPAALVLIAIRFVWQAHPRIFGQIVAAAIAWGGYILIKHPDLIEQWIWFASGVVLVSAVLGAPVFTAMAGLAVLFYLADGTPVSAVSAEVYKLIASPTIPAIPLLTACGCILAETRAAERLVTFFKALVGWLPGGIAVLVAGVCAVFTTFTGGSGVTIIALGGLAYGMLKESRYDDGFALGHVTASSSLGLLFPPSLPVIIYAVVVSGGPTAMGMGDGPSAAVAAEDLYIAGLLPGLLMALVVAGYGLVIGRRVEIERVEFDWHRLIHATWAAKWELSVPVIVIGLFASGLVSMVEAAAFAAAYVVVVQVFVTQDIHLTRQLPGVLVRTGVLVGAVLILLAAAMGLSAFCLVEAELPDLLLEWCQQNIDSKVMFLLMLNLLLLVLGSIIEIYSALVILPPIIAPIALQFGVDPVHLGIIFLANLELGFLTPPVGLNLFLSSVRFEQPITRLYKEIIPYLFLLLASVMIITYVPSISIGFLSLFK